jgi:hypothetical protein
VKNANNLDGIASDAIRNYVRRASNDQFACARNPAWATHCGMSFQTLDSLQYSKYKALGGLQTVPRDVIGF